MGKKIIGVIAFAAIAARRLELQPEQSESGTVGFGVGKC